MAAIAHAFTIRRAAQILGCSEDLLWRVSDQLEAEDGMLWVHDVDGTETVAFTDRGIDSLREIVSNQVDQPR